MYYKFLSKCQASMAKNFLEKRTVMELNAVLRMIPCRAPRTPISDFYRTTAPQ